MSNESDNNGKVFWRFNNIELKGRGGICYCITLGFGATQQFSEGETLLLFE